MRTVDIVTAQCSCGSYPVAVALDGRRLPMPGKCFGCDVRPVVLPVLGSVTVRM
jgi:hypothetical protein